MKLRIDGKSLRLRLSDAEVTQFKQTGKVEEVILFGFLPEEKLRYILTEIAEINKLDVVYKENSVIVKVPSATALIWANSNQNSIEGIIRNGTEKGLKILIEKDLDCLHRPD